MTRIKAVSIVLTLVLTVGIAGSVLAWSSTNTDGPADNAVAANERSSRTSTTTAGESGDQDGQPTPSTQSGELDTDLASGELGHEVLPGAGNPPPATPDDPIGGFGDDGPVPAGLGFAAPPQPKHTAGKFVGPTDLAVAPSCSHQCITKGVAYARGFGAELVVESDLPVQFYLSAVADPGDDGDFEVFYDDWTAFGVTSHSWSLDNLLPGQTYHVMVAATDDDNHTAYAWGEFTTLSQRTVYIELGEADVYGGPGSIDATTAMLGLDGTHIDVTPGLEGILLFPDMPRHLDIDYWMIRSWDDDLCEAMVLDYDIPRGGNAANCLAWNSARIDNVDLDVVPADKAHWTETRVELSLHPPTGAGDALPPGYGDPYYFSFQVPVTLHVSYS